jgi:hypothetical protein
MCSPIKKMFGSELQTKPNKTSPKINKTKQANINKANLFPNPEVESMSSPMREVWLRSIKPNQTKPRKNFS